jgi:hypothetical protein
MTKTPRKPTSSELVEIAERLALREGPNGELSVSQEIYQLAMQALTQTKVVAYDLGDGTTLIEADVPGFGAYWSFTNNSRGLFRMAVPPGHGRKGSN